MSESVPSGDRTPVPPGVQMRAVLVTGASGFLGRRLCARLRDAGVAVHGLARRPAEGPWDALFLASLGADPVPPACLEGVDTVFHLAARVHALEERAGSESLYQRDNVEATAALARAADAAGVSRFVNFSSVKAMGEGDERLASEDDPPAPQTPYGRTKLEAEALLQAAHTERFRTVSLRLPMVYGSGGKGNLARMMRASWRGRMPRLPDTGNHRSMLNAANAVDAALLVASHPRGANGGCFIVTDARDYSTAELQQAIWQALGQAPSRLAVPYVALALMAGAGSLAAGLLGRRVGFDRDALDKLLGSARYSSARLQRELGYAPRHTLADGLREMAAELRSVAAPGPEPASS